MVELKKKNMTLKLPFCNKH